MNTKNDMKRLGVLFFCPALLCAFFACTTGPKKTDTTLIALIKARDVEGVKAHFNTDEIASKDTEGLSPLHIAVLADEPQIVSFLLKMGTPIEETDPKGRTPLVAAVSEDCFESAKILAQQGANVFAKNTEGKTAFHIAFEKQNASVLINSNTILQKDANSKTILHYAVEYLDEKVVADILQKGTPCHDKDSEGQTALFIAYKYPQKKAAASIAAALLRAGSKPLQGNFAAFETAILKRNYILRFGEGETLLHITARAGQTGFVQFLIDEGVVLDAKNASNATPLHTAVQNGHVDTVKALLAAGASVNAQTNLGNTALHLCMASSEAEQLTDLLLQHHADPRIPDMYGETPLHTAVRTEASASIVQKLVDAGCYANERNKKGETPLLLAVERSHKEHIAMLIDFGADIHTEDIDNRTPFTQSLSGGLDIVSSVLTEKTSIQKDSEGRSALHIAVANRAPREIIVHIINQKNTINAGDKSGNTPLHIAVTNNDKVVGEILLAYGADIFFTNKQEYSPLKIALSKRGGREVWLLTDTTVRAADNVGNTALHYTAEWNFAQLIPYIIEKGGNINAKNTNGETPLFSAVKTNSTASAEALLRIKTEPVIDITSRDFLGNTALHAAVRWSAPETAEIILRHSGSTAETLLAAKNSAGKTALHISAQRGFIPFITMLLGYKADKNVNDETGKTPLTDAVQHQQEAAAFFLLQKGATPVSQDMYGRTVFHEAAGKASIELITAIREAGGSPMVRDISGATPLSLVLHTTSIMIDAVSGSDPLLTNSDGETPLHIAASEDVSVETMKQLLAKGYAVDKRDRTGSTALLIAVKNNMPDLCSVLLAQGADPFSSNNTGESAASIALEKYQQLLPLIHQYASTAVDSAGECLLHYAARLAAEDTIKTVIDLAPEQLHKRNIAGELPYDIAIRWKRTDIAGILQKNTTSTAILTDKVDPAIKK